MSKAVSCARVEGIPYTVGVQIQGGPGKQNRQSPGTTIMQLHTRAAPVPFYWCGCLRALYMDACIPHFHTLYAGGSRYCRLLGLHYFSLAPLEMEWCCPHASCNASYGDHHGFCTASSHCRSGNHHIRPDGPLRHQVVQHVWVCLHKCLDLLFRCVLPYEDGPIHRLLQRSS